MFMDPATDVVLPFNWCACSVLLYLCALVLAACAVCAIEEGRSLYWTPADKWLPGVIGVRELWIELPALSSKDVFDKKKTRNLSDCHTLVSQLLRRLFKSFLESFTNCQFTVYRF